MLSKAECAGVIHGLVMLRHLDPELKTMLGTIQIMHTTRDLTGSGLSGTLMTCFQKREACTLISTTAFFAMYWGGCQPGTGFARLWPFDLSTRDQNHMILSAACSIPSLSIRRLALPAKAFMLSQSLTPAYLS